MLNSIRVLIIEDSPEDAELLLNELVSHGLAPTCDRVETEADYLAKLETAPDIILADYQLPHFSGLRALEIRNQRGPDIPFIVVSGILGDEKAAGLIKLGATDFLLKDRMARVGPAVAQALQAKRARDEQRKLTEALAESERRFRTLVDCSPDAVFVRCKGNVVFVNDAGTRLLGATHPSQLIGKRVLDLVHPDDREIVEQRMRRVDEEGVAIAPVEQRFVRIGGSTVAVEVSVAPLVYQGEPGAQVVARDITERKRAEEAVRRSEAHYRSLFENMREGFAYCRMLFENDKPQDFMYIDVNDAFERLTGLKDVVGKKVTDVIPGIRESNPELFEIYGRVASTGKPQAFEIYLHALGIWFSVSAYCPGKGHFVAVFENITGRKRSELALFHLNRALKTLSSCNVALVHAVDEAQLLREMCRNIVEIGGYRLAWVGFAEHDAQKTVRPVAYGGYEEGFMERASVTWADTEQGRGPVGTAIRTRKPQVIQNVHTDPMFEPWRANAVRLGYGSVISLPLVADGKALGALSIYSGEINAFDQEEIRLLGELADDLAYGLMTLRSRAAHEQSGARLQRSMEETIAAIAATVEMRDPYTAGHQRRVAELGVAIARDLKLPEESIHAIRLAGTVHDLGKINVPAEILSKPSRLTEIEYRLIQTHPQAGYDILKAVDFPWPIAQIVYQHHERLDGCGYPQGLMAEQILIEARILAVADVVEAMASHRPYRPALGLDAAFDEITKYRGTQFEPAVVDACVALFREKRFVFTE